MKEPKIPDHLQWAARGTSDPEQGPYIPSGLDEPKAVPFSSSEKWKLLLDYVENGTMHPDRRVMLQDTVTELARLAAEVERLVSTQESYDLALEDMTKQRDALAERVKAGGKRFRQENDYVVRLKDRNDALAKRVEEYESGEPYLGESPLVSKKLRAEVEQWKGHFDRANAAVEGLELEKQALAERVRELEFGAHGVTADELRAEITRLREAIHLAEIQYLGAGGNLTDREMVVAMRDILREALQHGKTKP